MKAVFSDIDGTLSKGFVTVDFVRHLWKQKLLDEEAFRKHEALMQSYKDNKANYLDLVPKWSQIVAECFNGFEETKLKEKAREFFEAWKKEGIYSSTKPLIKLLKEKGYLVFLISAGWDYLAELIGKEIEATGADGMKLRVENGKYVDVIENKMFLEEGKTASIKALIEKYDIDPQKTMGFGDSVQDKAILGAVHKPIALNPSKELKEKALKEKWYIATHENVLEMMEQCFSKEKK